MLNLHRDENPQGENRGEMKDICDHRQDVNVAVGGIGNLAL